jgi:hypothetical protein
MQTQRCRKAEALHERDRKALRLVGDDAPGNFACFQFCQVFGHACEEAGADAERVLVDAQEALLQGGVGGVGRRDAESGADHAACARRDMRAQLFQRQRVAPLFLQQAIEGPAEVGRGVRQRAVEVEEYGFRHCAAPAAGN